MHSGNRKGATGTISSSRMKETQHEELSYEQEDEEFYVIGDRVFVDGRRSASVAYFGETEFGAGDWVGVVLDKPEGSHDGKIHGREYFQCPPRCGLFVRPNRITRMADSGFISGTISSKITTPVPARQKLFESYPSKSPGTPSTIDSYFYDEDYRNKNSFSASLASFDQRIHSFKNSSNELAPMHKGILKKENQINENKSNNHSENQEKNNRLSITKTPDSSIVFNFRPKRVQLPDHQLQSNSDIVKFRKQTKNGHEPIEAETKCKVGDRVIVRMNKDDKVQRGTLQYLGETNFATGIWAGVELDREDGRNDGSLLGYRYFYCHPNHGLFVPASRISPYTSNILNDPNTIRGTLFSPPPLNHSASRSPSQDSSASSTPNSLNQSGSSKTTGSNTDYDQWYEYSLPKNVSGTDSRLIDTRSGDYHLFNDDELDYHVRRSLKTNVPYNSQAKSTPLNRPKSIRYTFTSSKYDGNPVVRRTVVYY